MTTHDEKILKKAFREIENDNIKIILSVTMVALKENFEEIMSKEAKDFAKRMANTLKEFRIDC